ncbi:hypothetical protein IAI51_04495 [Pseudomonas sp. N40(2020)]|uniref:hypothetical protein n=1 Tax=Pseudomonas sp. N40(2020) TaxID=2767798 RepID=UPI0016571F9C|nr:hypothetical protein [Pseudomonas sp. N40(2020)]MBC8995792.1 hypothetical protein [Pseudomonas sp. N40(2020)]
MTQRIYKKLEGMTLKYVSGRLEQRPEERAIRYTVSFDMDLDFTHFVQMANVYSPGYLDSPVNAIRPELDGLAYHYSYNYLFSSAGNIRDNEALFKLFTSPDNYMDDWATSNDLEVRYGKPAFAIIGRTLRITAHQDFRVLVGSRQIEIEDLPIIRFQWALNLLEGHAEAPGVTAPITKVVLMYAHEDLVEAEGLQMFRGTRYINSRQLSFGNIAPSQILTAQ